MGNTTAENKEPGKLFSIIIPVFRETFVKIGGYQDIPRTINESLISLFDFTY